METTKCQIYAMNEALLLVQKAVTKMHIQIIHSLSELRISAYVLRFLRRFWSYWRKCHFLRRHCIKTWPLWVQHRCRWNCNRERQRIKLEMCYGLLVKIRVIVYWLVSILTQSQTSRHHLPWRKRHDHSCKNWNESDGLEFLAAEDHDFREASIWHSLVERGILLVLILLHDQSSHPYQWWVQTAMVKKVHASFSENQSAILRTKSIKWEID